MSFKVSNSGIKTFKRCRRKYYFNSTKQLGLEPKVTAPALWFGTGIHYALERFYGYDEKPVEVFQDWADERLQELHEEHEGLWEEEINMLEEKIKLGKDILKHYKTYSYDNDSEFWTEVIATEVEFEIPIYNDKGNRAQGSYCGKIDMIVKDEYDRYWIVDHKTAKQFQTDHLELDEQMVRYIYAGQQIFDFEIEGAIYNMILKKAPTEPKELVNGGISTNKRIKTTYDAYMDKLIDYYGRPEEIPYEDYEGILQLLKEQDNPFFKRVRIRKSQAEVEEISQRIFKEYKQMRNPDNFIPSPNKRCMWDCDFRDLCIEINKGQDISYLINQNYQEREARY